MQRKIIFAGGTWTWCGPGVNYKQSFDSTIPALDTCLEHGVSDIVMTMWGDDGSECNFYEALIGMQLYSEYTFSDDLSKKHLQTMFKACVGCDYDAFMLLDMEDIGTESVKLEKYNFWEMQDYIVCMSKQALYQNPLLGVFDKNFSMIDLSSHYKILYNKINKVASQGEFEDIFEYHRMLLKVLMHKCDFGIRAKRAYDDNDKSTLQKLSVEAKEISTNINILHDMRENMWYKYNRPFGFEELSARLKGAEGAMSRASKRLSDYASGCEKRLMELEEERLYYNGVQRPNVHDYFSSRIMWM